MNKILAFFLFAFAFVCQAQPLRDELRNPRDGYTNYYVKDEIKKTSYVERRKIINGIMERGPINHPSNEWRGTSVLLLPRYLVDRTVIPIELLEPGERTFGHSLQILSDNDTVGRQVILFVEAYVHGLLGNGRRLVYTRILPNGYKHTSEVIHFMDDFELPPNEEEILYDNSEKRVVHITYSRLSPLK